jgi:hypothetical protein
MDVKITQQPLLVWVWVVSTGLTILDAQVGLGWVGGVATAVFLLGALYFVVTVLVRLDW